MKNLEELSIKGVWKFKKFSAEGLLLEEREVENLVVNVGKALIAGLINGAGLVPLKYVAIGTGTTAPAAGNTTLQNEITTSGGQRLLATCSNVTTTITGDTARLVVTYAFTGSFAVTESGTFSAAVGGVLGNRATFTAINVINGQSLLVQVDLKVA